MPRRSGDPREHRSGSFVCVGRPRRSGGSREHENSVAPGSPVLLELVAARGDRDLAWGKIDRVWMGALRAPGDVPSMGGLSARGAFLGGRLVRAGDSFARET